MVSAAARVTLDLTVSEKEFSTGVYGKRDRFLELFKEVCAHPNLLSLQELKEMQAQLGDKIQKVKAYQSEKKGNFYTLFSVWTPSKKKGALPFDQELKPSPTIVLEIANYLTGLEVGRLCRVSIHLFQCLKSADNLWIEMGRRMGYPIKPSLVIAPYQRFGQFCEKMEDNQENFYSSLGNKIFYNRSKDELPEKWRREWSYFRAGKRFFLNLPHYFLTQTDTGQIKLKQSDVQKGIPALSRVTIDFKEGIMIQTLDKRTNQAALEIILILNSPARVGNTLIYAEVRILQAYEAESKRNIPYVTKFTNLDYNEKNPFAEIIVNGACYDKVLKPGLFNETDFLRENLDIDCEEEDIKKLKKEEEKREN